jgi:DNA-binding transcriptional LysR family regulator
VNREKNIPFINLNLLHAFIALGRTLSFKDAALRISRSQSAVSSQIRLLEEQLGVPLFKRTTRTVVLTRYGEYLLQNSQHGLDELARGFRHIIETAHEDRSRVILACSPSIASTWLPKILKDFEKRNPAVSIVLREMTLRDMMEVLSAGEVDFGLGFIFLCTDDLVFEPIFEDPYVVLAPSSLPLPRESISLSDIAKLPLLLPQSDNISRSLIDEAMEAQNLKIIPKYECTRTHTLISLVRAGLGATIVPLSLAKAFSSSKTKIIPIKNRKIVRQLAIIHRKSEELLPGASSLVGLIREQMGRRDD